ncbi:unnamed protein product [Bursaphelenchus xylophilus]|uniref:Transmembrane protein 107 n=1 Tax=Bursaphelenchus xylophilus TaxID=6326 RepID=A0A1I7S924_BURXY|nr:unnamed protein product [Bursaphelenchus xylophilus]CAG9086173.1 unnamed protein product [Bursaphelenchus xylophilus]
MYPVTGLFLASTAHFCIIGCIFWNIEDHVQSSIGERYIGTEGEQNTRGSLILCLTITICLLAAEILFKFRQILSEKQIFFALVSHTICCLVLLKFVVDLHVVSHFWYLLIFGSGPTVVLELYVFMSSYKRGIV